MAEAFPPNQFWGSSRTRDWTCVECGNVNFARRTVCYRCQQGKRPSADNKRKLGNKKVGWWVEEESKGFFKPNDWLCNKCGNVNWVRRQQCKICHAPKFEKVVEKVVERTGLGGGYNDRGVVEYKEREDSDGEFDEFGRKKKKRSNSHATSDYRKYDEDTEKNQEEVEEEDEDEDDGDLSKYDLSEWGSLKEDTKKTEK